jgi:hypothetical protein
MLADPTHSPSKWMLADIAALESLWHIGVRRCQTTTAALSKLNIGRVQQVVKLQHF